MEWLKLIQLPKPGDMLHLDQKKQVYVSCVMDKENITVFDNDGQLTVSLDRLWRLK